MAGVTGPGHFRVAHGLHLSSFGIGTYRGAADDIVDRMYNSAIQQALANGINVVDTARIYRGGRSERVVGEALASAIRAGIVKRDEVIVSTKGGLRRRLGSELRHAF